MMLSTPIGSGRHATLNATNYKFNYEMSLQYPLASERVERYKKFSMENTLTTYKNLITKYKYTINYR